MGLTSEETDLGLLSQLFFNRARHKRRREAERGATFRNRHPDLGTGPKSLPGASVPPLAQLAHLVITGRLLIFPSRAQAGEASRAMPRKSSAPLPSGAGMIPLLAPTPTRCAQSPGGGGLPFQCTPPAPDPRSPGAESGVGRRDPDPPLAGVTSAPPGLLLQVLALPSLQKKETFFFPFWARSQPARRRRRHVTEPTPSCRRPEGPSPPSKSPLPPAGPALVCTPPPPTHTPCTSGA